MKEFFYKYIPAFAVVLILFFFFFLVGCSPKIITHIEKEYVHDTLKMWKFDSIYFEKSDTTKMSVKGDTIFIEKIKWRIKFDIKEIHDTTKVVQVDIQEKEIPIKYTPKFFKICTILFWSMILLIIIIILFKIKNKSLF